MNSLRRLEAGQLATQLRTDRTTGARHQHPTTRDVVRHCVGVDVGRVTTQEVELVDRTDVGLADTTQQLIDRRQHEHPQVASRRPTRTHDGSASCRRSAPPPTPRRRDASTPPTPSRPHGPRPGHHSTGGCACGDRRRATPPADTTSQLEPRSVRNTWSPPSPAPTTTSALQVLAVRTIAVLVAQTPHRAGRDLTEQRQAGGEHRHRTGDAVPLPQPHRQDETDRRSSERDHPDLVETAVAPAAAVQARRQPETALQHDREHDRHARDSGRAARTDSRTATTRRVVSKPPRARCRRAKCTNGRRRRAAASKRFMPTAGRGTLLTPSPG